MLAIERKNEILAILQKEQRVLVSELSKRYDVTDETIRRDLEKLESEGYVKKTYGGAVLNILFKQCNFRVHGSDNSQFFHAVHSSCKFRF